jgi:amino acid transporter
MNSNINFNELWAKQKTGEPNKEELLSKINKFKKSNLKRLIITNLLLIITSLFIIFIWVYYQPQMITTKIGIILTILAMVIFVIAYNQSFALFRKKTNTQSNSEYLKNLIDIKAKQRFIQTTMLNLYFVLLSTGIGLYMYEYTQLMTAFWGIFAYGITSIWILFNWFYLRPKQIKKQQTKLDEIIGKLEILNEQLNEKE